MRHHYVPQFLLRSWAEASPDGKIEVFRLDLHDLVSSRRTPKNTGYENNLYALSRPMVAGMEEQAIEKQFLRDIDNLAAIVRQKLVDRGFSALRKGDRSDWARFLMSLRLRQPSIIEQLVSGAADHLRRDLASKHVEYEGADCGNDTKTLEEWTNARFPGLIENFGLSFFHKLVDDQKIGNHICMMKWCLWDFSDEAHDLVLGDHPCIFTTDLGSPDLIIALPISPTKAFMATQSERVAVMLQNQEPRNLLAHLNEASIKQARARIYARDKSHERFIRNRLIKYLGTKQITSR